MMALKMIGRRAVLVSLLAGASLSCDDPLAPEEVAGTYALRSGAVSFVTNDFSARVLGDTLILFADGRAERRTAIERTSAGSPMPLIDHQVIEMVYQLEGRSIWLAPPCRICLATVMSLRSQFDFWGDLLIARDSPRTVFERVASE